MSTKILLVEDNLLTAKGLSYLLEFEGYHVEVAPRIDAAKASLALGQYALILLDVSLPDGEGFELARDLKRNREKVATPIIFLTARDDEADIVRGLELGAEDYIAKPFHNRELLLRIRKALRSPAERTTEHSVVGDFTFTPDGTVKLRQEILVLSPIERSILLLMLENPNQIITRERLVDEIYQISGKFVNDNTVSVYLKRLRQKLGKTSYIETVKSLGYRLHTGGMG